MRRGPLYLGVAVFALAASSVLAQDTPEAETAGIEEVEESGRQSNPNIDEITVTGTQSDVTNIQNESNAVSAFSMEELDRSNIVSVDNLAFNVPALHVGQTGSSSIITLRGIGTENSTITGEPGLQFHVDGVNYPNPSSARVAFFDLEGLQVLRGPQGFAGGKNATAGHIQVSTRKPTSEFETDLDYQWGNYDKWRTRGAINIPLNEYVQTRFAFFRDVRTGFQENLSETVAKTFTPGSFKTSDKHYAFDSDDWGYRGQARFINPEVSIGGLLPTELLLSYSYYEQGGVGPSTELQRLPLHEECGTGFPSRPIQTRFPNFAACGRQVATDNGSAERIHEVYKDKLTEQHNEYWGWTGTLDWDFAPLPLLGETQLKSITSYQQVDIFQDGDLDATDIALFSGLADNETQVWLQEFQWSGSASEFMDWQFSAFYSHEESTSLINILSRQLAFARIKIDQEVENTSLGLALNTDWYLRDGLTLTLGWRWIRDKKVDEMLRDNAGGVTDPFADPFQTCVGGAADNFDNDNPGVPDPDGIPDPPNAPPPVCEEIFRHLTGTAKLQYFATDNSQLYGSVSSGFKSGGFAAFEVGRFKPEYIWSFEIGNKNTLFDDRLTLNMAAYHYHYRDLQLTVTSGPSTRTDNADAEVQGFELEFSLDLLPGLRLNGQGTYTDAEITEYLIDDPVDALNNFNCNRKRTGIVVAGPAPCIPLDFSGNQLTRAPEFSYTLGVEYDLYLGRYGTLTPRLQYYWQDDTWFRAFNRTPGNSGPNCPEIFGSTRRQRAASCGSIVNDLQEAYHRTDIKATWRSPGETYWFEAAVQNLENEVVYQNVVTGSGVLGNPGFAWYGPPRIYTFTLGIRF